MERGPHYTIRHNRKKNLYTKKYFDWKVGEREKLKKIGIVSSDEGKRAYSEIMKPVGMRTKKGKPIKTGF